ncbi:MAG TPA: BamA/TamA family outer membrane protein [Vicinamibacterales bacterium]|nr:BamA/TamA family outer membrane protein [Vicinamibacterales bacterium]
MWRTSAAALLAVLLATPTHAQDARIEVTDLTIEGVKSVPKGELTRALATSASSWIPWGTERYFNRAQFEADLKRIEAFYGDRGFPDAKVSSFDLNLDERQEKIAITIVVSEGEPIVVEEVRFAGFDPLPQEHFSRLKRAAPLRAGQPRDRAALQMMRERALDELRDHGYPFASVRVRETPGSAPRRVVVTYDATPGQLAYFGPIDVAGNSSVSDGTVLRHLTYKPGQVFRLGQVQESQRRLYSLELFEFVNVDRVTDEASAASGPAGTGAPAAPPLAPASTAPGQTTPASQAGGETSVPTRVTLTEGKHRKLNWGVGYGSEEKARTEANWRHVNFFGGARTAGVEARWSSLDRGLRLNFQQPYFFSPRIALNMSAEAWNSAEPAYTLTTAGGRITFQRRFSMGGPISTSKLVSTLSFGLLHQWEDYTISREALEDLSFRDTLIALKLDPRFGTGRGSLSAIAIDYSRNTTGNLLDARRGYVASAHFEEAGRWLPGDFNYREVALEGRHYWTLFDRLVWANRARIGSITAAGDAGSMVPFFKRYFLGGSSSLRGWGRFQVSPLSGSGLPIGGHSMLEASSEFRIPVWGNLSLVLFGDAGNVWSDRWRLNLGDLRFDVGPGLRYNTPIGPVRFDFGYQINPIEGLLVRGEPEPRRFRMHFSIGQAF